MPGKSFTGDLPPLDEADKDLLGRLKGHVDFLAGSIGQRNHLHPDALELASGYAKKILNDAGLAVTEQWFEAHGMRMRNIIAERRGSASGGAVIVVGAHYDSVVGSAGADDNASAVAALLELARLCQPSAHTLRFVAFANEEVPMAELHQTMGSYAYAQSCLANGDRIKAMLSLEMLGYYQEGEGTQKYPSPFSAFYPSTGNFIAFVGNTKYGALVRHCVEQFRRHALFPCQGISAPESIRRIWDSDHASFWRAGFPALMVTDTANFRNPNYHLASDVPDTIDYDKLARVTSGLIKVIEGMSAGFELRD